MVGRVGWFALPGGTPFYGTVPAGQPEIPSPDTTTAVDDRPTRTASKQTWQEFASRLGVNTVGLTKDGLIAAVDDLIEPCDRSAEDGAWGAFIDEHPSEHAERVEGDVVPGSPPSIESDPHEG